MADRVEVSDLILGQVGEGRILAWAATEELTSGDALGAAALVFWTEVGLEVHAIGMLRGVREGARLRLHHGDGVAVVILESQVCEGPERCETVAKFFPIVARRFTDVPLLSSEGACLGEASFPLHRKLKQPREGAPTRRFELQRTIDLTDEGIYIVDLVTGDELESDDELAEAKPFRRVIARRMLEFVDGHFVLRDRDLWEHVLRDYGLVRPGSESVGNEIVQGY